jgi:hypothetical protein
MIDTMNITNAKYVVGINMDGTSSGEIIGVEATIDGNPATVPLDPANRHYAEIMRQVEAGELTIAEASAEG